MKMVSISICFCVLGYLLVNSPAHTKGSLAKWISYGVEPCSRVVASGRKLEIRGKQWVGPSDVWFLIGWVSGFATAVNSAIDGPSNFYKGKADVDIVQWVISWCRDNPNGSLDSAMRALASHP